MTHDSWVKKKDKKENVPQVLAAHCNTLANAAYYVLKLRQNNRSSATAYQFQYGIA